ncbi:hypothetical protein FS749_014744 [Ceratobasidium sp. UAMH 11750]|nr:hypothetical protein FS749_014744 [Ceratobasidium sp. UAMH 11750]
MFSRLGLRAFRTILVSLSGPFPLPAATRTIGRSRSPTPTRTTATHHPALPKPAYARLGRSCASCRLSRPTKHIRKPYGSRSGYSSRLAHLLRTLYSLFVDTVRFPAAFVEAFLLLDTSSQLIWTFNLLLYTLLFTLEVRQVHYHCTVIIEGYQFSSKRILNWERTWTADCAYFNREDMDWKVWEAIDRDIQCVRMEKARIRGLSLKVRVIRERTVRDRYFNIFGLRSVEVPEDPYHGTDVFETEDDFLLSAPDLDCDLELPKREWGEIGRDLLLGEPPTPPSSAPPTPSPRLGAFVRPVRIADPGDPPDAGEDERMLWH